MADASKLKLPHRAEHIGSLLRPRELRDAFKADTAGQMNDAAYREVEDRNIIEAIRMQEEAGLATISDGEFRRGSWAFGLVKAVEGFGEARSMFEFQDAAGNSYPFDTCYAVAKIRRSRPIAVGEFEFVRRHTKRVPKVTMPAPSFMHFFRGKACADPAVYPDVAAFWADLLRVDHEELGTGPRGRAVFADRRGAARDALRSRGARAGARDRRGSRRAGHDVHQRGQRRARGAAGGDDGRDDLCRGNLRSRWLAAGSYEAVAERLFNEVRVDAFFLEYDTPRAGDFAPLRLMAKDKTVVLGLDQHQDARARGRRGAPPPYRRGRAPCAAGAARAQPQCGFASTVGGNLLSIDDERRKLGLVVEVAKRVRGEE